MFHISSFYLQQNNYFQNNIVVIYFCWKLYFDLEFSLKNFESLRLQIACLKIDCAQFKSSREFPKELSKCGNDQEIEFQEVEIHIFHEIERFCEIVKKIGKAIEGLGGHYFRVFSLT